MAVFVRLALISGHRECRVVEQFLQHMAQVAKDRLAQPHLHGFQVAHALLRPVRLD